MSDDPTRDNHAKGLREALWIALFLPNNSGTRPQETVFVSSGVTWFGTQSRLRTWLLSVPHSPECLRDAT